MARRSTHWGNIAALVATFWWSNGGCGGQTSTNDTGGGSTLADAHVQPPPTARRDATSGTPEAGTTRDASQAGGGTSGTGGAAGSGGVPSGAGGAEVLCHRLVNPDPSVMFYDCVSSFQGLPVPQCEAYYCREQRFTTICCGPPLPAGYVPPPPSNGIDANGMCDPTLCAAPTVGVACCASVYGPCGVDFGIGCALPTQGLVLPATSMSVEDAAMLP